MSAMKAHQGWDTFERFGPPTGIASRSIKPSLCQTPTVV